MLIFYYKSCCKTVAGLEKVMVVGTTLSFDIFNKNGIFFMSSLSPLFLAVKVQTWVITSLEKGLDPPLGRGVFLSSTRTH